MSAVQTYRVIIAHGDPEMQRHISELLEATQQFRIILTTYSGDECLEQTVAAQPELVIVDTLLSGMDGLEVLRRVKFQCPNTRVLLLTGYNFLANHRAVVEIADYCIVAPYKDSVLVTRALELFQPCVKEHFDPHLVLSQTADQLAILGVPLRLKGYPYVSDGVQLSVLNPDVLHFHAGPNGLYAQLCRRHNEKYRNIERCMRSVGDRIFKSAKLSTLEAYFTPADQERGRIANLALISTLAEKVTEKLRAMQADEINSSSF